MHSYDAECKSERVKEWERKNRYPPFSLCWQKEGALPAVVKELSVSRRIWCIHGHCEKKTCTLTFNISSCSLQSFFFLLSADEQLHRIVQILVVHPILRTFVPSCKSVSREQWKGISSIRQFPERNPKYNFVCHAISGEYLTAVPSLKVSFKHYQHHNSGH